MLQSVVGHLIVRAARRGGREAVEGADESASRSTRSGYAMKGLLRQASIFLATAASLLCWLGPACAKEMQPISKIPDLTICGQKSPIDQFHKEWYCDPLTAMHEPGAPLQQVGDFAEVYRFLWYRSFHPGMAITVKIKSISQGTITMKADRNWQSAEDGPLFWKRVPDEVAPLTEEDIATLHSVVHGVDFWNLPTEFHYEMGFGSLSTPIPKGKGIIMSDGSIWIVEGLQNERYHVIGDCGGCGSPADTLGIAMINLAHRKFPEFDLRPIY